MTKKLCDVGQYSYSDIRKRDLQLRPIYVGICVKVLWYTPYALAGNRTRVARVAGEHSTTEPPMLDSNTNFMIKSFEELR